MREVSIDNLLDMVSKYDSAGVDMVREAFNLASELHDGQYRQSGEPYIIHPLHVAYILADMHADVDTICAGLLHDTLEDTDISKEDIIKLFNKDVAMLVDGVTKISKMNFSSKEEENMANTRKIITGITEDVRIIIIKLSDRLHNMRTLEYKTPFKQKENALETMDIFVPLAKDIGVYRIKSELEDISLKYLKPDKYKMLEDILDRNREENERVMREMLGDINDILNTNDIPHEIKTRTKNIYGIYKRMEEGRKISDIHDLLALKVMVDDVKNCYVTLGLIHSKYNPINDKFKDYICNPKTNLYQSLHTTVFGGGDKLVQAQVRTFDMDKIASFGLTAYWEINKDDAMKKMQSDLKNKYQFFKSLTEMNAMFGDNKQFVNQVKKELFHDNIYVYTSKGDIIELPKGATIIDFAYRIHTDIGNLMVAAKVNDEYITDLGYKLKNKDRVVVITDDLSFGPRSSWEKMAKTSHAKKKIRDYWKKN